MMKIFFLFTVFFSSELFASRPVFEQISRSQMIEQSNFIFSGWPSVAEPLTKCDNEFKRWWVHKVYKGDKSLQGKVISVALNNYKFHHKGAPSYRAFLYNDGNLNLEQGTSFLYTTKNVDGCFELAAQGAQDHRFLEPIIDALFASPDDCSTITRGLESLQDKMPNDCQVDRDCQVFLEHPMTCSRPNIWNKKASHLMDSDYLSLRKKASTACAKTYSYMSTCKPEDIPFHCGDKVCKKGYSKEAMKVKVKFVKASVFPSCAPHDGPATMIWLSSQEKTGPSFSLSWWGDYNDKLLSSKFIFKSEQEKEFNQSFCPMPQGCKTIKKSELTIIRNDKNEGTIKYFIETNDQEIFEGTVPISNEPKPRAICG